MTVWKNTDNEFVLAIAKSNFAQEDKLHRLTLDVGDTVVILKETTHWYYGFNKKNKEQRGIFPKSYVQTVDCVVVKDELIIKRSEIVEEITTVLVEWGQILKQFYLATDKNFQPIRQKMFDLIRLRSFMLSGNLPVDEMREIKMKATSHIDTGNSMLKLDMVVRDRSGNVLDTTTTCTTELYQYHRDAVDRIKNSQNYSSELKVFSHNVLLTVQAFVCKFQEDSDLLFTLYDGVTETPITENYVVKWGRQGINRDIDQINNNRVLFTDLSKADLEKSKIYLVCYAIRIGAMELKETDAKRASSGALSKKNSQLSINSNTSAEYMRRPFGVACKDLTPIIRKPEDFQNNIDLPFIMCERENLDSTLKKLMSLKDLGKYDSKIAVSVEVLHGDLKQVKQEFPHLIHGNMLFARKMGFPEIILPGDVRNDLYLTVTSGEFLKSTKGSDKNIEVTAVVCNEKGEIVPGIMTLGAGYSAIDEYKSVVYHHDDKPKWAETFKIHVPIEEFKQCHLKFMFRHRSSNEQKDRAEKPFGLAYAKLMQANGTAITQGTHKLAVYRIDHKKFDKNQNISYMDLPSSFNDIQANTKPSTQGLTLASKDFLQIDINLCSTKLTQNVVLLGILNWASHKENLGETLESLNEVPAGEMVKFLQDVLDALFKILTENDNPEKFDQMVFMSIIRLIEIVSSYEMYKHFQMVLDLYINESFSATLAYDKLMDVLQRQLTEVITATPTDAFAHKILDQKLYQTTKYLPYIIKFIIRSRILFAELRDNMNRDEFEQKLEDILHLFIKIISSPNDLLKSEGSLLRNLHYLATDLSQIYDPIKMSHNVVNILNEYPPGRLIQSKMTCIRDFVDSKLFQIPEWREVLLPVFCKQIKHMLDSKEEGDDKYNIWKQTKSMSKASKVLGESIASRESTAQKQVSDCVTIMNNILKQLHRNDIGPVHNDIRNIMMILLRTVIQAAIAMDPQNPLTANLIAIMLGILNAMHDDHYNLYVQQFSHFRIDLQDFLTEILCVFRNLVSNSVFEDDWMDMIMHQNVVILKVLRRLATVIIDRFFDPFEKQVWLNYFQCAIAFLIQSPLQLDRFTENKKSTILARYRDIRKEMAAEISMMWFQLGEHKRPFVPSLVGELLEMSFVPEIEVRRTTIPIFFDMMQCEYYSSIYVHESYGDTKRNQSHCKANFAEFETEMIQKLDLMIESGLGDVEWKHLFHDIMMQNCTQHSTLNVEGARFVDIVTKLVDRLLEYRCIMHDESKENRMACTVMLLEFYSEVNRKEMYIRYVYKLCDLHMEFDNFTEAGFTLKLHSNLLMWNDAELSPLLRSDRHNSFQTHRQLKEALYYDIIEYFDRGKMWECAIGMCKELAAQFESEIYDYMNLSVIHKKMAQYYEKILQELRHKSAYFRVEFFGLRFPRFLRNQSFVYRGQEYEALSDFCGRILVQHPAAELMQFLTPPGPEITQSDGQFIRINSVDPIMDEKYSHFRDKIMSNEIVEYYASNNVQKFKFSRRCAERDGGDADSCANIWLERTILTISNPLPGKLRWYPVVKTDVIKISPLENAIETMEVTNQQIRDLIIKHKNNQNAPIHVLSMKVTGILDPAVMGGIKKYEEAFITEEYLERKPEDYQLVEQLKELLASQIPLLEIALSVMRSKSDPDRKSDPERKSDPDKLMEHLEKCFVEMQANIESKYGKRTCDLKLDRDSFVVLRRNGALNQPVFDGGNNRLSETSMGSSDSGLSKSTFGGRSQATNSLKATLTSFNFNTPRTSLGHSPNHKLKSKEKTPNKRSFKKSHKESLNLPLIPNCQWYTSSRLDTINAANEKSSPLTPPSTSASNERVRVLTEELTPKRPLRSEVEKERRLSRPTSIATPTVSSDAQSLSGGDSSNRNSVESTSEDELPPPLPAKTRDSSDLSSLPANMVWYNSLDSRKLRANSITNTAYEYFETTNYILASPDDKKRPPTPPPKPSRNTKIII